MQIFTRVPKFGFVVGMLSLVAAVGCGTYNGSPAPTKGTGNFSNATLNGSYVYQIHGTVNNQGILVPYREVGVFTADGNGNITGGTDDSSVSATGTAITGIYNVSSSGIGTINFNTSSIGGALTFGITVVGSSQVQMIEGDSGFTAAGTANLQNSSAAGTAPTGTFVFRLHQEASANNNNAEASQVGAFSLSSGGAGAMDQNLNGSFTADSITVTLNAPASGRGTGTLNDTTAGFVTDLVYYIIDGNTLALLVDNGGAIGSGSAEAQSGISSGTGPSGSYVFGSRGDDPSSIDGVATVGQFTATSGSISGTEDLMQDGNFTAKQSLSACFSSGAAGGINGRVTVIANGSAPCTATPSQVFWMVNPNRAFFLNNSGLTFQDGTADVQTLNSFANSTFKGQFSLLMDGFDLTNGETLSRVGAMQFDGAGNLNLSEDINGLVIGPSQAVLTGTYSVGTGGRTVGTMNSGNGPLDVVIYPVSGSQAYVLQGDAGFITSGTLVLQQ